MSQRKCCDIELLTFIFTCISFPLLQLWPKKASNVQVRVFLAFDRSSLFILLIFISDDYGFYPHHTSCDKYWKCDNGAAELKTCGNGLAFEATDPKYLSENCDYHHNVECGDRTQFGKYEVTVLFAMFQMYFMHS